MKKILIALTLVAAIAVVAAPAVAGKLVQGLRVIPDTDTSYIVNLKAFDKAKGFMIYPTKIKVVNQSLAADLGATVTLLPATAWTSAYSFGSTYFTADVDSTSVGLSFPLMGLGTGGMVLELDDLPPGVTGLDFDLCNGDTLSLVVEY